METKEEKRDVIYVSPKEDNASSALNILFGIMMGVLLIFVIYLASLAMLGNWNPIQPNQLNIETTTPAPRTDITLPTPPVSAPNVSTPAPVQVPIPAANQESTQSTTSTTTNTSP